MSARRKPPPDTQAIQRSCATLPKPLKLRQTRDCLKHGSSKSLRELQKIEPAPFTLQEIEGKALVDVTAEEFLGGLVEVLSKAANSLTSD